MIYGYTYIKHPIQRFHEGLMYFFRQMLDLDIPQYDESLHIEAWFQPLVNQSSSALLGEMKKIVEAYHNLTNLEKQQVIEAFESNQNIEEICKGNGDPKKYEHIGNIVFRDLLSDFFDSMWKRLSKEGDGINAEVIRECNTIMDHFGRFREHTTHKTRICPFCGTNPLKPSFSGSRNAYDHYLPKSKYPFVSVNFKNLAPMCHECNSDEKGATDTIYNGNLRRVVYYPFEVPLIADHLEAKITTKEDYKDLSTLLSDIEWDCELNSNGQVDCRLQSWDDIFRLRGRYKEILIDYEQLWYQDLKKLVKKYINEGKTFEETKVEILDELKIEFVRLERTIIRYAYVNFLFHLENIEEDLMS